MINWEKEGTHIDGPDTAPEAQTDPHLHLYASMQTDRSTNMLFVDVLHHVIVCLWLYSGSLINGDFVHFASYTIAAAF